MATKSLQQAPNGPAHGHRDQELEMNDLMSNINDVVSRMATKSKKRGLELSKNPQLDDIQTALSELGYTHSESSAEATRGDKVRRGLDRTLECIQTLGEVATGTAVGVSEPAKACYNAVNFVIKAYQNYKRSFETLAQLLEMCFASVEQIDVAYREVSIKPKLRKAACKQLKVFVDTCEYAFNLRYSRRSKMKLLLKITFLNDNEVQKLLEKQKSSTQDRVAETITNMSFNLDTVVKSVMDTEVTTKEYIRMQREGQDNRDRTSRLLKAFNLHGSLIDSAQGKIPNPVWEKPFRSHCDQMLKDTGLWLQEHTRFSEWAYKHDATARILGVTGGEGTGKSALAAYIIHCLRQRRSDTNVRSYVSYYFMKRDSKEEQDNIASTISGSLLWQLAESYQPFFKSASSKCDNIDSAYDLWTNLLFNNEELFKSDSVFFFVFDGFTESVHLNFLGQLLDKLDQAKFPPHRIRLLITGKDLDLKNLADSYALGMQTIELGRENLTDIELFIEHHMARAQTPKSPWRHNIELKKSIMKDLRESNEGNYRDIIAGIEHISNMKDEGEIERWLTREDVASIHPIAVAIEELDRHCSPSDLQAITELILGVMSGKAWLSPIQLEAALLLRSQALTGATPGVSNRQKSRSGYLKSKLQNQWHQLFDIDDDGDVTFKNTGLDTAGRVIPLRQRNIDDRGGLGNSADVQPAEVALLQHYLKSMCPTETYEKFGFAMFFNDKLLQRENRICQDPRNAEITLSLRCLTCLVETRNEVTQVLYDYALEYLSTHLRFSVSIEDDLDELAQASALSSTDSNLRAQVGPLLMKLFTEDYALNSLLQIHHSFDNEESAVKMAVKCFLTKEATDRDVEIAFTFLLVAEARSQQLDLSGEKTLETYVWTPSAQRVQEVEAWSWQIAPPELDRSTWEARMASVVLHFYLSGNECITKEYVQQRAKFARGLSNSTWQVSQTLARAVEDVDAAEVLEDLIKDLTKDRKWCDVPSNRPILAEIYLDLGDRYWTLGDSTRQSAAFEMHLKSIKEDTSHRQRYLGIISRYAEVKAWGLIKSFIEALSKRPHSSDGTPIGKMVVQGVLEDQAFSTSISDAAENLNEWGFLKHAYDQALRERMSPFEAFSIRRAYGEALQNAKNEGDKLLKVWEDMLEASKDLGYLTRPAITFLVPKLMPIYTKRAILAAALEDSPITPTSTSSKRIDFLYEVFRNTTDFSTYVVLYFTRSFLLRKDRTRAIESVAELLAQSLDMMSNDDQSDDIQCFIQLQAIFSTFNDVQNTCAAWQMVAAANEQQFEARMDTWKFRTGAKDGPKYNQSPPETEDWAEDHQTPKEPSRDPVVWCDDCGKEYSSPSGIWTCMDESGLVQLDQECYRLLKGGKNYQGKDVCDSSHHLMQIPKFTVKEIMGRMKDGKVRVGECDITLDGWKESIIAEYEVRAQT
ncbi:hypothetical protein KVR01_011518 [Diaporthe batatas]|uniref:uncharacterized protein n=1 Tax=Diaporthe batatas TaxID=748121 RepID=UPI001D04557A|nr:uncharacterized protein KVR01_011518 [Diaporthe batatas]KAG8158396.1 hypothetical protein KVR01_011518 [Diaporthe batatas]